MLNGEGVGPTVLLVHHNGIGSDRERGGGALGAAANFRMSLKWEDVSKPATLTMSKAKASTRDEVVELDAHYHSVEWAGRPYRTLVWTHRNGFSTAVGLDDQWWDAYLTGWSGGAGLSNEATRDVIQAATGGDAPTEYAVGQWRKRMQAAGRLTVERVPRPINAQVEDEGEAS
jgi:hypothetical protein